MWKAVSRVTPAEWEMIFVCLFITLPQGIFLFRDAQKRGRFPWLWGLWGAVSFPLPAIFYYFFILRPALKKKKAADIAAENPAEKSPECEDKGRHSGPTPGR